MKIKIHCSYEKMVGISDLIPHPLNPNTHTKDQIEKLALLIKYHGWRKPVTVSNLSRFVIRGHGRLLAARSLGDLEIPVDYQDYESEDQEFADLVADNKISEHSYRLEGMTGDILKSLSDSGIDASLAGFDIKSYSDDKVEKIDENYTTSGLVQLPYVFRKAEKNKIMKILNKSKNPETMLLEICK